MKTIRKIIHIDEELCDGCGECVPGCAEGALEIVDGKAKLVKESYCDGLGACLGECPNGAITMIEREAEDFDEQEVEIYLKAKEKGVRPQSESLACGCPSTQIQTFIPSAPGGNKEEPAQGIESRLSHWPVQIRLVPPDAPFLKGAELLIAADCTPIAYPDFHRDFIDGRVVMMGCPKFDDTDEYIRKFAEIFKQAEIKGIKVAIMEVPCCSAMPVMLKKAMDMAGKDIPIEEIVIGTRGDIL